jgi:cardiolipin synthase
VAISPMRMPLPPVPRDPLRLLAEQAFSRAAGAPLIPGNGVRLLKDAQENYPAWLEALRSAQRTIDFEAYILHADKAGYEFAELLAAKARQGVRVRLIYDWLGARGSASFLFWRKLRRAGVEVRCFNPPRLDNPVEWLSRDHRKVIAVDGRVAFVSGLCVGQSWVGDPLRHVEPWRDTGVRIEGPAVVELSRAFEEMWNSLGPANARPEASGQGAEGTPAGNVALRIVPSQPNMAGLYRLDQLIAALARKSIWLTDAYFLGTPSYVQSLRAAAFDGVDVRLLLPRTSDIPIVRALSRVGYRTLLESGVRIFEWNGSMLHAKTSVADGRWSRVGSTNLNVASWMTNYEMDVVIEDEGFAREMEEMYLQDLERSTEIVLSEGTKVKPVERRKREDRAHGSARGSAGRAATGVLTIGSTVGAAITSPRLLGPTEAPIMIAMAFLLLCIVAVAVFLPFAISVSVAVLCGWAALAAMIRAFRLLSQRRK